MPQHPPRQRLSSNAVAGDTDDASQIRYQNIEKAHGVAVCRSSRQDFPPFRIEVLDARGIGLARVPGQKVRAALADYEGVSVGLRGNGVSDELATLGQQLLQHWTPDFPALAAIK